MRDLRVGGGLWRDSVLQRHRSASAGPIRRDARQCPDRWPPRDRHRSRGAGRMPRADCGGGSGTAPYEKSFLICWTFQRPAMSRRVSKRLIIKIAAKGLKVLVPVGQCNNASGRGMTKANWLVMSRGHLCIRVGRPVPCGFFLPRRGRTPFQAEHTGFARTAITKLSDRR